jgi:hypothetical protein
MYSEGRPIRPISLGTTVNKSRETNVTRYNGSGAPAYQATRTAEDQGVDRGIETDNAGMGSSLQASPRPKALQPTRPLGCAPDLVASFSPLAELRLEIVAGDYSVQRVRACELGAIDPILGVSVE